MVSAIGISGEKPSCPSFAEGMVRMWAGANLSVCCDRIAIPVSSLAEHDASAGFAYGDRSHAGQTQTTAGLEDRRFHKAASARGFVSGTRISTPTGWVAVEDLCTGDLVWTQDGGARAISLALKRHVTFGSDQGPGEGAVLFPAGVFGAGQPEHDVTLMPHQHLLWRGEGGQEYLLPAAAFVGWSGVVACKTLRQVVCIQIVLPSHELMLADGIWVESFFPDSAALQSLRRPARKAVTRIFDATARGVPILPARPVLSLDAGRQLLGVADKTVAGSAIEKGVPVWRGT